MQILNHQNFQSKSDFFLTGKNDVTIFPDTKKFISPELYTSKFLARSENLFANRKKRPPTYGDFELKFLKIPKFWL